MNNDSLNVILQFLLENRYIKPDEDNANQPDDVPDEISRLLFNEMHGINQPSNTANYYNNTNDKDDPHVNKRLKKDQPNDHSNNFSDDPQNPNDDQLQRIPMFEALSAEEWKGEGFCCFCNEECNPLSQAHSRCAKQAFYTRCIN